MKIKNTISDKTMRTVITSYAIALPMLFMFGLFSFLSKNWGWGIFALGSIIFDVLLLKTLIDGNTEACYTCGKVMEKQEDGYIKPPYQFSKGEISCVDHDLTPAK